MAGKTKRMSQIKQLIRLYKQGMGKKAIARQLGISKNTVKAYLAKFEDRKLPVDDLLSLDEPVLESKLFAGNPSYKEGRYEYLKEKLGYFAKELKRAGVTRQLLWREYRQSQPDGYSYTQFCYHLGQYLLAQNPSMVLQHRPGEKLFIDFAGKTMSYIDRETGEIIECQVFVACLPYSDYCFAMAVHSQNIEDFIYALKCCLKDLGGVPRTLVPDNLKTAIKKANRYEPDINRALEDFANHYETTVTPTRTRKPKDKALVENQVRLIYARVYAKLRNQTFFDIHSLNSAIREKIKEHNQTRMQLKDYCREEKFLAEEKNILAPLPSREYEIKYYKELKVAKNNHIYLSEDKHYYSVHYTYIGRRVLVIYTRSMVYIYAHGNLIAVHIRDKRKSGYTTDKDHLCSEHKHYLDRSPEYYLRKAKNKSNTLFLLFEQLFKQDKFPEQLYRTCDGLLSMQRKTDPQDFDRACVIAMENEIYSYRFIANIIKNRMTKDGTETAYQKPLPFHENTRGAGYYK
jgi:transposase